MVTGGGNTVAKSYVCISFLNGLLLIKYINYWHYLATPLRIYTTINRVITPKFYNKLVLL